MSDYMIVLTTVASDADAKALARALLERRLVACVNVLPDAQSLYRWQGKVADESECVLLIKTRVDRYDRLAAAIKELHPYEVPELIAVPITQGSSAYLRWIDESLGGN